MAVKKWIGGAAGATGDLSNAANWAPSGVPTNSDDVYIEGNGTDYDITAGLTTFAAVTLNSVNISITFSKAIGIANTGTSSTTIGYMSISGTNTAAITVNMGYQNGGTSAGGGGNLWRLNTGSALATFNITGSATSSQLPNGGPITLLGTHTSNVLNIISGVVSVAADPTETAKFLTINNRGNLALGTGVTLTTINQNAGSIIVRSGVTTYSQTAGASTFSGTGTTGTMNLQGGTSALNSTGTITALNIYGATANLSGSQSPRTITTATLYAGATINLNNGVKNSITITNPIVVSAGPGQFAIVGWFGSSYALS